jgi:hypothetical protein
MAWFKRPPKVSDEELLARENPLVGAGEWEQILGDRRTLHRRRSASTSREFRRDLKYVFFGALLGAVVVAMISFGVRGISIWQFWGDLQYNLGDEGVDVMTGPAQPVTPVLFDAAWAAAIVAFFAFLLRRLWRRRR